MANHVSAEKRHRQSQKRRKINAMNRHKLKTQVKKFRSQLGKAGAEAELPATYSAIDKSVQKGVVTKNAAARYKSRLAKAARSNAA